MADNPATPEDVKTVLDIMPQKPPFRFIDEITELTLALITGTYRYREDEFFYKGHFPGKPITPGVILIETMAQFSIVALGIYNRIKTDPDFKNMTFFTECEIEFTAIVMPGSRVTVYGEKIYYRRNKIKAKTRIVLEDGTVAASGVVSGMGVEFD